VLIGVIYLLLYIAGNLIASPVSLILELLLLVAVVSVLSIIGGIGYWMSKTWGWFVHLASVFGQLLFPGGLFEFKPDLYHMIGWIGPLISLVILIAMGIHIRQKRPG
jgi:uncharacterized membrane protein (DUF2068 family)